MIPITVLLPTYLLAISLEYYTHECSEHYVNAQIVA